MAYLHILDKNEPPVARFRLLSGGVSPANALEQGILVSGDSGCLACGNCVDACPVVLRRNLTLKLSSERTSMYLETETGSECIRCYACIRSCPQVKPELKRLATRFRLGEKISHWWMAVSYIMQAITGIMLYHFRPEWSPSFNHLVGVFHRIFAVSFLLTPLIFFLLDRPHFQRMIQGIKTWSREDWLIMRQWAGFVRGREKAEDIFQGEFHPLQKAWYLWVLLAMFSLGITGIIRWTGTDTLPSSSMTINNGIHSVVALITDLLFIVHFYRKLIGRWGRRAKIHWLETKAEKNGDKGLPEIVSETAR